MFIGSADTTGNGLIPVATADQSAPWVAARAKLQAVNGVGFNNKGDSAYVAGFSSPDDFNGDGLFLRMSDGTHRYLVNPKTVSPAGGFFDRMRSPTVGPIVLTDDRNAVFAARTSVWDGFLADSAIFSMGVSGGRTIARENDHVPGLGSTVVYNDLCSAGNGYGVDPAGHVLFKASLDDTRTVGLDGDALLFYDPVTDHVSVIAVTGTSALVDIRGDGSVFSSIAYITADIPDPNNPSDNNANNAFYGDQAVFRLNFVNGMSGIYVATIPEPSAFATITFLAVLLMRRRIQLRTTLNVNGRI